MKKINILILLFVMIFSFASCKSKNEDVDLSGFNEETKQAIHDLVKKYGNTKDAYVVSDFDNTIAIESDIYANKAKKNSI